MSGIGSALREARLRDGWDFGEVEERTKIRAKYLRALEDEEWGLLPGPTYTKGFLRTYGEALGLDWRLLVDEYKREWEEPHEGDVAPVRSSAVPDPHETGRVRMRRWAGFLALIVVLAIGVVLIGRLGSGPGSSTPPPSARDSGASGSTSTGASGATTVGTTCLVGAPGYVAADCVSLRIKATTTSLYVCLIGDGRRRLDGVTLAAGAHTARFHARDFLVTIGSKAAVLVVDGHRLTPVAASGPVRYSITPAGHTLLRAPTTLRCAA